MSGFESVGDLRAGDADRDAVARILQDAHGAGRLDLHELDERLATAYAARTYAELDAVVADLPVVSLPWRAQTQALARADDEPPLQLKAGWSTRKRDGRWRVPRRMVAEPAMSDVYLDFREADCPHPRVDIEMRGGMGSVVLIVPDGWSVDTDAVDDAWGSVKNKYGAPAGPGLPTIFVTGTTGIGTLKARGPYFYE